MHHHSKIYRFQCHASFKLIIILIVGCALFLGLSYWQFQRGIEKRSQEKIQNASLQRDEILSLSQSYQDWQENPITINDRLVQVKGEFEPNIFLLHDNRIQQGLAGYNIYGLFKLSTPVKAQNHILINLGWSIIPHYDRTQLPSLTFESIPRVINLKMEAINPKVFQLEKTDPEILNSDKTSFIRVQSIQFHELESLLQVELIPFVGRTTEFLTQPKLQLAIAPLAERGISANKHFGYSAQWLLFCLIAIGIFLYTQCSWYHNLQESMK